jgi:hypothetical protein
VSEKNALQRRYRRLLAAYPADHRRLHGEEMVHVLLASARPGQRWPRLADAADLLAGALRIRLRRRPAPADPTPWSDALAVVSLVAPLLLFAGMFVTSEVPGAMVRAVTTSTGDVLWPAGLWSWAFILAAPGVAVCALLGSRRGVAIAASATAVLVASATSYPTFAAWLGIDIAALSVAAALRSPGPRRGRQILGWRGTGAIAVTLVVIAALTHTSFGLSGPFAPVPLLVMTAGASSMAGVCLTSRVGRRVLVLLMIPGLPTLAFLLAAAGAGADSPLSALSAVAILYAPLALVVCLALAAVRPRKARREVPPRAR